MSFAEIEREYVRRHFVSGFEWVGYPTPSRINPLAGPLSERRVALVGTAGVHMEGDPPSDVRNPLGDTSFRVIPRGRATRKIRPSPDRLSAATAPLLLSALLLAATEVWSMVDAYRVARTGRVSSGPQGRGP